MNVPFPPIGELLPHRGDMLLVDAVTEFTPDTVAVRSHVDPGAWYAAPEGAMPAWIGLELMAQAIGAHASLCARAEGKPAKRGLLLGARRFAASVEQFAAGEPLSITARLLFRDENGFAAYECAVLGRGRTLAVSEIKAYEPADFGALLAGGART